MYANMDDKTTSGHDKIMMKIMTNVVDPILTHMIKCIVKFTKSMMTITINKQYDKIVLTLVISAMALNKIYDKTNMINV